MECKLVKVSSSRRVSVIPRGNITRCQACSVELGESLGVLRVSPKGGSGQYSLLVCNNCLEHHKWRTTIRAENSRFVILGHRIAEFVDSERFDKIKTVRDGDEFPLPEIYHVQPGGKKNGISE